VLYHQENQEGKTMTSTPTPEFDKMTAVADQSQLIGEFLDWASQRGYEFGREVEGGNDPFAPATWFQPAGQPRIQKLLAEFFSIDLDKVEAERRTVLQQYRHPES
jgi:hypothetical protein